MSDYTGKTLKDYNPAASVLQGGKDFNSDKGNDVKNNNANDTNNLSQSPFDSQRGSGQEDESIPLNNTFPFKATWDSATNEVEVAGGSYHYLNTNTDVPATSGTGTYVYAVIKRLSRWDVNIEFSIEITFATKDPTNLDSEGEFVEFSNVLLAEVVPDGDTQKMVQRRAGNFTMINQIVNGLLAVWPLSSGGTI